MERDNILEKIKNKDPEGFEKLYREYKTVIYNYLLIKTKGDEDVSNDVLSETFCSLMEKADKIKNLKNIENFLLQIASRRLSDFLRKKYHDANYYKYFDVKENADDTLADDLHTKEQLLSVSLAMDNLNPLFKNIIRLRHIEEKSQNEIAGILNRSVSSIESLLVRARKELRKELKKIKGFFQ